MLFTCQARIFYGFILLFLFVYVFLNYVLLIKHVTTQYYMYLPCNSQWCWYGNKLKYYNYMSTETL